MQSEKAYLEILVDGVQKVISLVAVHWAGQPRGGKQRRGVGCRPEKHQVASAQQA